MLTYSQTLKLSHNCNINMKRPRQRRHSGKEWKKARSKQYQEFRPADKFRTVYLQNHNRYSHYSHACQMTVSISRCVRRWQIFAYVKQTPTLFEVLLNRLPHFTTDTLSHLHWHKSWSCNMKTCIQTKEHTSQKSHVNRCQHYFPKVDFWGVKGH